jgi:hypothetical protein
VASCHSVQARLVAVGASLALCSGAGGARAQPSPPDDGDVSLPCRPTIACTADLVPPGAIEIESGALYRRGAGQARRGLWMFPAIAKLTLVEAFQLQLGTNGYTTTVSPPTERFIDDVVITPKLHFLDQTKYLPSLSFSAELSVPTLRATGYLRTYDTFFTGYATKDIGPIHADLNVGVNLWRLEDRPAPQAFSALALSANLVPPFGLMVEGYVFSDALPVSHRDGGFLFALSHSPKPWLVFDVGADIGFFPSTRAFATFLGMTIIPVFLWRTPRSDGAVGARVTPPRL